MIRGLSRPVVGLLGWSVSPRAEAATRDRRDVGLRDQVLDHNARDGGRRYRATTTPVDVDARKDLLSTPKFVRR